jgi:uncharacterized membrane protein YuzA (DUF378 family)
VKQIHLVVGRLGVYQLWAGGRMKTNTNKQKHAKQKHAKQKKKRCQIGNIRT